MEDPRVSFLFSGLLQMFGELLRVGTMVKCGFHLDGGASIKDFFWGLVFVKGLGRRLGFADGC